MYKLCILYKHIDQKYSVLFCCLHLRRVNLGNYFVKMNKYTSETKSILLLTLHIIRFLAIH